LFAVNAFGLVGTAEDHLAIAVGGHFLEHGVLRTPVEIVGVRHRGAPALIDAFVHADEPRGILEGQGPQQDGFDDAENCGVGSDAEGKGEDCHHAETGALRQHAKAETEVLCQVFEEGEATLVAVVLFCLFNAAKLAARSVARFFRTHPAANVFLGE
jgi:hypothetical protein